MVKYRTYVIKRILFLIPIFFGVSFITWFLADIAGSPLAAYVNEAEAEKMTNEELNELAIKLGLGQPWYIRFFKHTIRIINQDWGISPRLDLSVSAIISNRLPASVEIGSLALITSLIIGIPLGVLSASKKGKNEDSTIRTISSISSAFPIFISALILQLFIYSSILFLAQFFDIPSLIEIAPYDRRFNNKLFHYPQNILLGQIPATGFILIDSILEPNLLLFIDAFFRILLPVSVIAFAEINLIIRITRAAMLEILKSDFLVLAKAKGLRERTILYRHAFRNALYPLITYIGVLFNNLIIGIIFAEIVFNYPGIGSLMPVSMSALDLPLINGFVLLTTFIFVISNLIIDLMYAKMDPRVRIS